MAPPTDAAAAMPPMLKPVALGALGATGPGVGGAVWADPSAVTELATTVSGTVGRLLPREVCSPGGQRVR